MARQALASCGLVLCLLVGSANAALPVFQQPGWSALTSGQKAFLEPLKDDWNAMDAFRRKKWLGIATRYGDMTPEEQASIQRNMRDWARLSSEERKAAREQYKKLKKVEPEKRLAVKLKWEEYSALPPEERDRLRGEAPKRPQLKTPTKSGLSAPAPSVKRAPTVAQSPLSPIKPPQSPLVPKEGMPVPPPLP